MGQGDPQWSEPRRVRAAVRVARKSIGYVTTVDYPNRDLTAFPEGTPYFEVTVSDLRDRHVAMFQRFKKHWLIHCGPCCGTTESGAPLTEKQLARLAVFALQHATDENKMLVAELAILMDKMLGRPKGT
jgi:hypothetical protein